MNLVDLTHNDTIDAVAQKCNRNFKQLGTAIAKLVNNGGGDASSAVPPISAYVIDQSSPALLYPGTQWNYIGSLKVNPNDNWFMTSLWQRTA